MQPRYCEPEVDALEGFSDSFKQGLVVPMYQESVDALERFCTFAEHQRETLLIVVANQPDNNPNLSWAKAFLQSPSLTTSTTTWQSNKQNLSLHRLKNNSALLLIDRCLRGSPIPNKQGVGLARKIGADVLCALIDRQFVNSPWIANSDADAHLPTDYFSTLEKLGQSPTNSAVIFPYQHVFIDNTARLPTLLYEFTLFYYVAGLAFAESPYAYHTLGSTLCCHYKHYTKVRGFPKRAAAEDFYLLNKLAKTGFIHSLKNPVIELEARESNRVPFGTGPAVISLAAEYSPIQLPLYHPDSFVYLRFLLQLFPLLTAQKVDTSVEAKNLLTKKNLNINLDVLLDICQQIKLQDAITHCHQHGRTAATRLQQLQHWFDGFKTLKLIHLLRDQYLGTLSFEQWLKNASQYTFKGDQAMEKCLTIIKTHL
jgi:hypothetical protein